jgi:hypothetical protein
VCCHMVAITVWLIENHKLILKGVWDLRFFDSMKVSNET